jgi:hypothetical protein
MAPTRGPLPSAALAPPRASSSSDRQVGPTRHPHARVLARRRAGPFGRSLVRACFRLLTLTAGPACQHSFSRARRDPVPGATGQRFLLNGAPPPRHCRADSQRPPPTSARTRGTIKVGHGPPLNCLTSPHRAAVTLSPFPPSSRPQRSPEGIASPRPIPGLVTIEALGRDREASPRSWKDDPSRPRRD